MPTVDFKGTYTALVTPFREDGSIDFEGFEKNISFQIDQGITGILPVGTTGESPTLSTGEHNRVVAEARKIAGGRCEIFAGAGSNSTEEALGHCRHALNSGIDTVLLVDCYYNGPSSLELRREYYETILGAIPEIKAVIYVIPGRTGTAIHPADIAALSDRFDRVIAIKEATGDLARMEEERSLMPDMSIMSGDDDKTFEMMTSGKIRAGGVISVTSNIAPRAVSGMVRALQEGERAEAERIYDKLKPLFSIVTVKAKTERVLASGKRIAVEDRFRNPLPVKALMNVLGMSAGICRKPLGRFTTAGIQVLRSRLEQVYGESPEILKPIEKFYGVAIGDRLKNDALWSEQIYTD
jgi:4-hydroxy-tetrahydrodipicolinate synthase